MSYTALALLLAGLLIAPHLLPQGRLAATSGIALWSSVLVLRVAVSIALVVVAVVFLPATELFNLLTHWCLHAVLPFFATHLGFDGHLLGDAAVIVPGLVSTVSLLTVAFGLWRGARAVGGWLQRSSLGPGPAASVIVRGSDIVVAAAGLRAPRVVVSAGALIRLDDAELAAGLEHEWGHVRRRHGLITLFAELCRGLSRLLPGGGRCLANLRFHLERDADNYAVHQTDDPLALASAICKAAGSRDHEPSPSFAGLAGSGVPQRLRRLTQSATERDSRPGSALAHGLATLMVASTVALLVASPTVAASGMDQTPQVQQQADRSLDCD